MRSAITRWVLLFLALTACTPLPAPTPTATQVPSTLTATAPMPTPTNTIGASVPPLPTPTPTLAPQKISLTHALYFLRREFNQEEEMESAQQIWRLAPDGATLNQITHESSDVQEFDIALETGWLAYITEKQLVLMKSDGSERQVIFTNPSDEDWSANTLSSPRWSANGRVLAFHQEGIYFYQLETQQLTQVIKDYIEEPGSAYNKSYFPVQWSPDGKHLVVEESGWEGGSWMVYSLEKKALTDTNSPHSYRDTAIWSADSRTIVFTSAPVMGGMCKNLLQFVVAGGQQSMLFDCEHEKYSSAGWPMFMASGTLQYFRSQTDGVDSGLPPSWTITPLPSSIFVGIDEALWADDGTLVILRLDELGSHSLELVPLDASQPIQLIEPGGSSLRWGP